VIPQEVPDELADVLAVAVGESDAHAVLWNYDRTPGVAEPGSFVQALVAAMDKADPDNLRRLAYGFPGLSAAVQLAKGHRDGIARLRALAGLPDQPPAEDVAASAEDVEAAAEDVAP
jgi:hypothetical protein